jgi:hypothetical protein
MGNINSINNISNTINSIKKINFQDMQKIINNNRFLIINTLEENNQDCLILNTISPKREVEIINNYLKNTDGINNKNNIHIVIYGENANDNKIINKYSQLYNLGFRNIYVYIGGLFEWLLLQELYGNDEFPTSKKELNILKYKATRFL